MITRYVVDDCGIRSIELFRPRPHALYSLDATSMLAGVSRRTLLMYCRSGFLEPVILPPYDTMVFTQDAIRIVKAIERVRASRGPDPAWLAALFEAIGELRRANDT